MDSQNQLQEEKVMQVIKLSNLNLECSGEVDKVPEEEREAPDGGKCDQEDCP